MATALDMVLACRDIRREIRQLEDRIADARAAAEMATRLYQHLPGKKSPKTDKMATNVVKLIDMEANLVEVRLKLLEQQQRADRLLDKLPAQQKKVMQLRYVDGLKWRDVAKRANYGESHCRRIEKAAMRKMSTNERF